MRATGSTTCTPDSGVFFVTRGHETAREGAAAGLLTRNQVAARLGVSLSTVRRLEGARLPVVRGADGVHRFAPAAVAALAMELAADPAPAGKRARPGRRGAGKVGQGAPAAHASRQGPPADPPPGELAARVFERLEQRQSLAEIVVGLRVAPALVRELHREWQRGLVEGELAQPEPVLPAGAYRRARERFVDGAGLVALLAELPMGTRTRISLARDLGDDEMTENPAAPLGWGELRRVVELGGFLVMGSIPPAEIARRYGAGDFRITAYGFDPPGVRWEVFARIERDAEREALATVVELLPPVALALPLAARAELPAATVEQPAIELAAVAVRAHGAGGIQPETIEAFERMRAAPIASPPAAVDVDTTAAAEDAAPWGDGSVLPVLGGRGLRAELATATLPPSSAAPRPAAPIEALPVEWVAMIATFAPRMRDPDPPGLPSEVAHVLAQLRALLASIPPVVGPALVALQARIAALTVDARALDPGAPVWKAARKRLASDYERDSFDRFLLDESMRRWLSMGGGNDPGAAVDALRILLAMSIAHEIEKHRGASNVPTVGAHHAKEG